MSRTYNERASDQGQPSSTDPADELMPCRICDKATPRGVLTQLGARCMECYRHYCANPPKANRKAA